MKIEIRHQWNGENRPETETAWLHLGRTADFVTLRVNAPFYDDPAPGAPPGSTPRLWEHEVVEWFVVGQGDPVPYLEIELGPHGHYLALKLCGVRSIESTYEYLDFRTHLENGRWVGEAFVPIAWLPPGALRHNAFTIRGCGDARMYSAAFPVPGPHPDFHRLDCFSPLAFEALVVES